MPDGTRLLRREDAAGNDGLSFTNVWLVTPAEPADVVAFFRESSETGDAEATSFNFAEGRVSVAPIDEIPQTSVSPRSPVADEAPAGMGSWIVAYQDSPASCPPCPEGFVGTTVPGCTCEGPAANVPPARYKESLRSVGPGWFVTLTAGGTFRSEDASCMGADAIQGTYRVVGDRVELTTDDERELPDRVLHVRHHDGTAVLLRERQLDAFALDPSLLIGLVDVRRELDPNLGNLPRTREEMVALPVTLRAQREDGRWVRIKIEPFRHLVDIQGCVAPEGRTRCSSLSYAGRLMEDGWAEFVRLQRTLGVSTGPCPSNEGPRQFALDQDQPKPLPADLSEESLARPCNADARLALWALAAAELEDD